MSSWLSTDCMSFSTSFWNENSFIKKPPAEKSVSYFFRTSSCTCLSHQNRDYVVVSKGYPARFFSRKLTSFILTQEYFQIFVMQLTESFAIQILRLWRIGQWENFSLICKLWAIDKHVVSAWILLSLEQNTSKHGSLETRKKISGNLLKM